MKDFTNLNELTKTSEEIYDGQVVHLFKDTVTLPNGKEATREVIRHVGAVAILKVWNGNKSVIA